MALCVGQRIFLGLAAGYEVEDGVFAKVLEELAALPVDVHLLDVLGGEEGGGVGTLGAQADTMSGISCSATITGIYSIPAGPFPNHPQAS